MRVAPTKFVFPTDRRGIEVAVGTVANLNPSEIRVADRDRHSAEFRFAHSTSRLI
jgi:hypothetical protein